MDLSGTSACCGRQIRGSNIYQRAFIISSEDMRKAVKLAMDAIGQDKTQFPKYSGVRVKKETKIKNEYEQLDGA